MLLRCIVVLAVLSYTNFTDAATGVPMDHCCQNELCPIDCVRCDGKATCYDLSDELGCSNETDEKLLSYQKPPIFVPIILAVLKAQIRREKVELSYRFPDRNCFAPVTPAPQKPSQPDYDLKGDKSSRPATTETPVWLQLLNKLKDTLRVPTTTTTTTETPIWKILLNKLKAEQNGIIYTTASVAQSWSKKKTTTILPPVSQTPPWRRTGRPRINDIPKLGTTEKTVKLNTNEGSTSSSLKTVSTYIPATIKETVFFIPPTTTSTVPKKSTEETTLSYLKTSLPSSTTQRNILTKQVIETSSKEISTTMMPNKTENKSDEFSAVDKSVVDRVETTADETNVPEHFYRNQTTERLPQSTIMAVRDTLNFTETPASYTLTSNLDTQDLTEKKNVSITSSRISMLITTTTSTFSNMSLGKENENMTEKEHNSKQNLSTEGINVTKLHVSSNTSFGTEMTEVLASDVNVTELKQASKMTYVKEAINITESEAVSSITGEINVTETLASPAVSSTTEKLNLALGSTATLSRTEAINVTETHMSLAVLSRTEAINVTETPASSAVLSTTEAINVTETPASSAVLSTTEAINVTETPASSAVLSTTEAINATETPASSAVLSTEAINVTESQASSAVETGALATALSKTEEENISEISALLTTRSRQQPMDATTLTEIEFPNLNASREASQNFILAKAEIQIYNQLKKDIENLTNFTQEHFNQTEPKDFSNSFNVTTEQLFPATENSFGATISTEFAKTITESETPSPLLGRTIIPDSANKTLETYIPAIKIGYNNTIKYSYDLLDGYAKNDKNEMVSDDSMLNKSYTLLNGQKIYAHANQSLENLNVTDSMYASRVTNASEIKYAPETGIKANNNISDLSIISNNFMGSDFAYSNLEKSPIDSVNSTIELAKNGTPMNGFEFFNSAYQKDKLQSSNSSMNGAEPFSMLVLQKKGEVNNALEDSSSSSVQLSPESEVRLMLGKLNALVNQTLASYDFPLQPSLMEYNQTQTETINVEEITTVTPSTITLPTTIPSTALFKETLQVTTPATLSPTKSKTATPAFWMEQTTLSPFSLDNLFGFTTSPLAGQNWFNPTTSPWDALFGVGGIPVAQFGTVPTFNAFENRLNYIYDPLSSGGEVQTTSNPLGQSTRINNQIINSNPIKLATDYTPKTTNFLLPPTEKPITSVLTSMTDQPTTKSKQTIIPQTQRPVVFNIFDASVDSPGNFSIIEPSVQPADTFKRDFNGDTETISSNSKATIYVEATTDVPVKKVTSQKQVSTAAARQPSKSISQIFTKVVSKLWENPIQTTEMPVTQPVSTIRTVIETKPTASWKPGPNNVLSTDVISSWWSQVHPTSMAPAYITQPTTTSQNIEQCFEVHNLTGFCQTRVSGHYKNPSDCRSFYVCIWGFLHSCKCPPGTMFDETLNVCNWDFLVTCTTSP